MKKMMGFTLVAVAAAFLSGIGYVAFAADGDTQEYASIDVRVEGQNYCVGCALGKAGANSSCSTDGHRHALKVTKAYDSAGKELLDLKGETIHYIYNTKGKEYTDGHHGEELQVSGKLYTKQHVIDIAKVEPMKKEGSLKKNK